MSYVADREEKEFARSRKDANVKASGTGARNTGRTAGIGAVAPETQLRNDGNPDIEIWSLI
jgi:hypothetical protein